MPEIVNNSVRVFELMRTRQARRESDSEGVYGSNYSKGTTAELEGSYERHILGISETNGFISGYEK